MGDATERFVTLRRGLSDLRETLDSIDPSDERDALEVRVNELELRADKWDETPPSRRALLLSAVFDATLEASELRRRSVHRLVAQRKNTG